MNHRCSPFSSTAAKPWSRGFSRILSITPCCLGFVLAGLVLLLLCWLVGPASAQEVRVDGSPPGEAVPVVRFAPRETPDNWQQAQLKGNSYLLANAGGRIDPGNYFIRVSAPGCEEVTKKRFVDASTRVRFQLQCTDEPSAEPDELSTAPDALSLAHRVAVKSSRGHGIDGASVQLTPGPGLAAQETAVEQTVRYAHESDGQYVASFNLAAGDVAENSYDLRVEARDHAPYVRRLSGLSSSYRAELMHNNYHARCNESMPTDTGQFWRTDPWEECSIDPDRLIETFGSEHANFSLPEPPGSARSPSFRGRAHAFYPNIRTIVTDVVHRGRAYRNLISQIVRAPARAQAIVMGRVAMDEIEQQLAANEKLSLAAFTANAAGTLAEITEALEGFAGPLSAAGKAFSLTQAHRDGQLEGLVQVAAHTIGMEQAVAQFEALVEESWLRNDDILISEIEDAKQAIAEEREATIEAVIEHYGNAGFNDTAEAIVFGASVKALFGGLLKAVAAGAAVKVAAVYVVYDFLRSADARAEERAVLGVASILDRELLSRYPDRMEDMDPGTMDADELTGAIMRLSLGILFNETRAAYLGGENRTLVGKGFQYVFASEMPSSEREAYEREMIRISQEKSEQAAEAISRLAERFAAEMRDHQNEEIVQTFADSAVEDTPGDSAPKLQYGPANRYAPGNGYEYFITVQEYTVNQDIPALLQQEFRPDAELAEWNELSALFSSSEDGLISFMEGIGMKRGAEDYVRSAFVTRAGNRFLRGSRHYFVSRHDGRVPGGWAVHAQLQGSRLSLGSWGSDRNALVRIPADSDEQATQRETPDGLLLDIRYQHQGSPRYYTFYSRGGQLVSQFREGDVERAYGCGIKNMTQDSENLSAFVTRCASGMGTESIRFDFGVDGNGRAYVDVGGGYRGDSERFYADQRRSYTCMAEDAVEIAADYFGPACDFGSDYEPYERIALNSHGREAFVMPSCAGPRTRGRITYLLVERRTPCQAIGTVSGLYDPAPKFMLSPNESLSPRRMGGEEVHWAAPYVLTVETSSDTYTYTFDWDAQEYRRSN